MLFPLPAAAPLLQRGGVLEQEGLAGCLVKVSAWTMLLWLCSEVQTASEVLPLQSLVMAAPFLLRCHLGSIYEGNMLKKIIKRGSIVSIYSDHIDGSPPGSPVPGILQARTLGIIILPVTEEAKVQRCVRTCSVWGQRRVQKLVWSC